MRPGFLKNAPFLTAQSRFLSPLRNGRWMSPEQMLKAAEAVRIAHTKERNLEVPAVPAREPVPAARVAAASRFVVQRDGACVLCGSDRYLSAHHVIPRAEGGADRPANLCRALRKLPRTNRGPAPRLVSRSGESASAA